MMQRLLFSVAVLCLCSASFGQENLLAGDPRPVTAAVDSTYPGYSVAAILDGVVYRTRDATPGHPLGPLGNAGNAWHSHDSEFPHWTELAWNGPRALAQLDVWWGPEELWPSAFRLEAWNGHEWTNLFGAQEWRAAQSQHTRFILSGITTERLRLLQRPNGGGPGRPGAMCIVEARASFADAGDQYARCRAGVPGYPAAAPELQDGRLLTYAYLPLGAGARVLEASLPAPRPVRQLVFDFLVYNNVDFAPRGSVQLDLFDGRRWTRHDAASMEDWSEATVHGVAQRMGRVRFAYLLDGPLEGFRLTLHEGNEDVVVCCDMAAYEHVVVTPSPREVKEAPARDDNLLLAAPYVLEVGERGQQRVTTLPIEIDPRGKTARVSVRLGVPRMISLFGLSATGEISAATPRFYLDGEPVRAPRVSEERRLEWSVSPLAVDRVDFAIDAPGPFTVGGLCAGLHDDGRWGLLAIQESPQDLWTRRLVELGEPNFSDSAAAMLPRRDYRVAFGAPGDDDETAVAWNGTHFVRRREDPRAPLLSRFFAFRLDGENFGDDYDGIRRGWTDGRDDFAPGALPEHYVRYRVGDTVALVRSFAGVGEKGQNEHLLWMEITLTNVGDTERGGVFEVCTGLVRWGEVMRIGPWNNLPVEDVVSAAEPTLLRNQRGAPVLLSDTEFAVAGTESEPACRFAYSLGPNRSRRIVLRVVCDEPPTERRLLSPHDPDDARKAFHRFWYHELLERGMRVELPEGRLSGLVPRFLWECLVTPDGVEPRYGSYFYEDYFGVEEGWPVVALARYGYFAEAQAQAEVMLQHAVDDNRSRHMQYRHGLAPMYAWSVYEVSRDRAWLDGLMPRMQECADYAIRETSKTKVLEGGQRVGYYGLLPMHTYGGDISEPAYGFYANACCWRGLRDVALACRETGDEARAAEYFAAAEAYRADIFAALDRVVDRAANPPFVPLSIGRGQPRGTPFPKGDRTPRLLSEDYMAAYWSLFAGLTLETGLFPPNGFHAQSMLDTLRERGGLWDGQVRFSHEAPRWDPHYGFGVQQMWFARDERDLFLASFYGLLANDMSRDTWSVGEVSGVFPERTVNFAAEPLAREKAWRQMSWMESEPIASGAGIALLLLRDMLVCEGRDDAGLVDGRLHLLRNAPGAWLASEKEIAVERAPTAFGRVSYRLIADWGKRRATLNVEIESATPVPVRVHLRLPEGAALAEVTWRDGAPTGQGSDWCEARVGARARCELRW